MFKTLFADLKGQESMSSVVKRLSKVTKAFFKHALLISGELRCRSSLYYFLSRLRSLFKFLLSSGFWRFLSRGDNSFGLRHFNLNLILIV